MLYNSLLKSTASEDILSIPVSVIDFSPAVKELFLSESKKDTYSGLNFACLKDILSITKSEMHRRLLAINKNRCDEYLRDIEYGLAKLGLRFVDSDITVGDISVKVLSSYDRFPDTFKKNENKISTLDDLVIYGKRLIEFYQLKIIAEELAAYGLEIEDFKGTKKLLANAFDLSPYSSYLTEETKAKRCKKHLAIEDDENIEKEKKITIEEVESNIKDFPKKLERVDYSHLPRIERDRFLENSLKDCGFCDEIVKFMEQEFNVETISDIVYMGNKSLNRLLNKSFKLYSHIREFLNYYRIELVNNKLLYNIYKDELISIRTNEVALMEDEQLKTLNDQDRKRILNSPIESLGLSSALLEILKNASISYVRDVLGYTDIHWVKRLKDFPETTTDFYNLKNKLALLYKRDYASQYIDKYKRGEALTDEEREAFLSLEISCVGLPVPTSISLERGKYIELKDILSQDVSILRTFIKNEEVIKRLKLLGDVAQINIRDNTSIYRGKSWRESKEDSLDEKSKKAKVKVTSYNKHEDTSKTKEKQRVKITPAREEPPKPRENEARLSVGLNAVSSVKTAPLSQAQREDVHKVAEPSKVEEPLVKKVIPNKAQPEVKKAKPHEIKAPQPKNKIHEEKRTLNVKQEEQFTPISKPKTNDLGLDAPLSETKLDYNTIVMLNNNKIYTLQDIMDYKYGFEGLCEIIEPVNQINVIIESLSPYLEHDLATEAYRYFSFATSDVALKVKALKETKASEELFLKTPIANIGLSNELVKTLSDNGIFYISNITEAKTDVDSMVKDFKDHLLLKEAFKAFNLDYVKKDFGARYVNKLQSNLDQINASKQELNQEFVTKLSVEDIGLLKCSVERLKESGVSYLIDASKDLNKVFKILNYNLSEFDKVKAALSKVNLIQKEQKGKKIGSYNRTKRGHFYRTENVLEGLDFEKLTETERQEILKTPIDKIGLTKKPVQTFKQNNINTLEDLSKLRSNTILNYIKHNYSYYKYIVGLLAALKVRGRGRPRKSTKNSLDNVDFSALTNAEKKEYLKTPIGEIGLSYFAIDILKENGINTLDDLTKISVKTFNSFGLNRMQVIKVNELLKNLGVWYKYEKNTGRGRSYRSKNALEDLDLDSLTHEQRLEILNTPVDNLGFTMNCAQKLKGMNILALKELLKVPASKIRVNIDSTSKQYLEVVAFRKKYYEPFKNEVGSVSTHYRTYNVLFNVDVASLSEEEKDALKKTPIDMLGLVVPVVDKLKSANYLTLDDLLKASKSDLKKAVPNNYRRMVEILDLKEKFGVEKRERKAHSVITEDKLEGIDIESLDEDKKQELIKTPVDQLGLSSNCVEKLKENNILTIQDILNASLNEIKFALKKCYPHFISVRDIRQKFGVFTKQGLSGENVKENGKSAKKEKNTKQLKNAHKVNTLETNDNQIHNEKAAEKELQGFEKKIDDEGVYALKSLTKDYLNEGNNLYAVITYIIEYFSRLEQDAFDTCYTEQQLFYRYNDLQDKRSKAVRYVLELAKGEKLGFGPDESLIEGVKFEDIFNEEDDEEDRQNDLLQNDPQEDNLQENLIDSKEEKE